MLKVVCKVRKQGIIIGCMVESDNKGRKFIPKEQLVHYTYVNARVTKDGRVYHKGKEIPTQDVIELGDNTRKSQKIILYHGSPVQNFTPTYGKGKDKHDYGRGFYLTPFAELAREWAMCGDNQVGWLHTYELDLTGLAVFDFNKVSPLCWLAELMKHRDADNSLNYRRLAPAFIKKFGVDLSKYDVIYGWRADSSYFSIGKRFVRNELAYTLIPSLFRMGDLENQYCLKSKKAFAQLREMGQPQKVGSKYKQKYTERDEKARNEMNKLLESNKNPMDKGIHYVLQEEFKNDKVF